jgi:ubiquinone/menaquinone biosynthesis C-methylase UbiE
MSGINCIGNGQISPLRFMAKVFTQKVSLIQEISSLPLTLKKDDIVLDLGCGDGNVLY